MCGIAGLIHLGEAQPVRPETLVDMIAAVRHRGPDGFGYYRDERVELAHARLSIIDLTTGDQPIHNEDGAIWVVFNGEIFNYIELRERLERLGHRFYTRSDTEVIVHAYEQYGDEFTRELNGQFAIALWDRMRRRLLLVRDRVGIRPLVYTRCGDRVYFGSEIKSLFAVPEVSRRIDTRALVEGCTMWFPQSPRTPFAGIESVPPGHMVVLARGDIKVQRYWDWQFPEVGCETIRSAEEGAEELRALLLDSTRLQLRSDVPVGSYLSGGLDSSAVTAMIRPNASLKTFALTFADAEFDESEFQQMMAEHLGTDHHSRRVANIEIARALPRAIWHIESPIVRTSPVPLMLLSESARSAGIKVVLTGEGADEVFGGYDLFKEAKIRRFWARQPGSTWRPQLLRRLYGYLTHSPVGRGRLSQSFFGQDLANSGSALFAHGPRWQTSGRTTRYLSPELRLELGGWDPIAEFEAGLPSGFDRWSGLAQDQYVEAHSMLSNYLLQAQGDRVAMANSIEGRYPFLDHRVIEFANRIRPSLKLRGLTEKYLLRKAVGDLLPPIIATRVKQPYRAPDAASFFENATPIEFVRDTLSETSVRAAGYFDPKLVQLLVNKCARGGAIGFADNQSFVFILSTMLLHRQFIERRPVEIA